MNAVDSDLSALRREVAEWLADNVSTGPLPSIDTREGFEARRAWERRLFDAGLAALHWPPEYGGRGLGPLATAVFEEEYDAHHAPERLNIVGLHICGPTLIQLGTDEQKRRWLPDLLSCEAIWSQGFSEPGAGSDLASISTRGDIRGQSVFVQGQKIWTSLGRWADWILALVRTDPDAPKHDGLSLLVIDRHAPGVLVRPIRQITGSEDFAEVFFDDVEVPLENVVGRLHGGWQAAMRLLANERGPGVGSPMRFERRLRDLVRVAGELEMLEDPYWTQQIAQHVVDIQAYRWIWERDLELRAAGEYPVQLASINKLLWTELDHRLAETLWAMLGEQAELVDDDPEQPAAEGWQHDYWHSRANLIAAGTNEIQRNVVAQRHLGLPRTTR